MTSHIGIALNLGVTEAQLLHLLAIVEQKPVKQQQMREEKCCRKL